MKKSTAAWLVIAAIIIIVLIVWLGGKSSNPASQSAEQNISGTSSQTVSAPVSETTKVSGKTSEYQNAELGFSVQYPNAWEKDETTSGVSFIMPIDQSQVSTIAKLEADINVTSGKCAFPPVTTVKDRGTITVANMPVNMISMSNSVQGRAYFNRMYSLQNAGVCYMFAFSSITLAPSSKNLTGSNLTQAQNNNKAIVNTSDAAFTDLVKSFAFVVGPQGTDETKASPAK